ncbi:TetR/AcrR family transcriptional regulator [Bradyrhizobium tunisiense]|uniref:TetR/AcrR family transcriptional regulator n=1 Tax=Bradyrhizobium tunisiense TaxID=3278709 RepID=UPI0035DF6A8E
MKMKKAVKSTKSDRTRAQILAAAKDLFFERGYDNTTIRDVAARALIDPAMVIRYFRTKDELFGRAAAIDLRLPALKTSEADKIGETLIRHFLDLWEGSGKGMAIMLRSATSNEFAAEKMREVFKKQVGPVIASVGRKSTAARRAGLVSSQLLGLALCRYVLKLPPVVALSREDLVAHVGPVLQRYAMDEV